MGEGQAEECLSQSEDQQVRRAWANGCTVRQEYNTFLSDRESTRGRTESELTEDPRAADRRLSTYSR